MLGSSTALCPNLSSLFARSRSVSPVLPADVEGIHTPSPGPSSSNPHAAGSRLCLPPRAADQGDSPAGSVARPFDHDTDVAGAALP